MIIATTVPNNFFMAFDVVKCWLGIPKLDFTYLYLQSCYIDTNRNKAVEKAKESGEDLLMIDSDILFTPNDIMRMRNHLKTGLKVVTGVYPIFMEGEIIPSIYKLKDGKYFPCKVEEGMNEVDACGGGFLGISKELIKELPKDPFSRIKKEDVIYGEDISFCVKIAEIGVKLICDSQIKVSQLRVDKYSL